MLPAGTMLHGGKIRIEKALGNGGFGVTYKATHLLLECTVVVKEYYPQGVVHRDSRNNNLVIIGSQKTFDYGKTAFLKEGRLLFGLHHPHIVRIFDVFEDLETAFIVMEYLSGGSLADELENPQSGKLSEERVGQLMGEIVSALAVCHKAGIYHLDLKPDNIVFDADGHAKLIDFGAARQGTAFATGSKVIMTPSFAPPELFTERGYGPESDVFETGVLLYFLLTGTMPPNAMQRLSGEHLSLIPLPSAFLTGVEMALRMERDQRPQDIAAWWSGAGIAPQKTAQEVRKGSPILNSNAGSLPSQQEKGAAVPNKPMPSKQRRDMALAVRLIGTAIMLGVGTFGISLIVRSLSPTPQPSTRIAPLPTPMPNRVNVPASERTPKPATPRATPKSTPRPRASLPPNPEMLRATPKPTPRATPSSLPEIPRKTPAPSSAISQSPSIAWTETSVAPFLEGLNDGDMDRVLNQLPEAISFMPDPAAGISRATALLEYVRGQGPGIEKLLAVVEELFPSRTYNPLNKTKGTAGKK